MTFSRGFILKKVSLLGVSSGRASATVLTLGGVWLRCRGYLEVAQSAMVLGAAGRSIETYGERSAFTQRG